ncbi:MAG: sulfatase [Armatimonadota bacterium]|nr:sulfatase [Armatimonadota bacterium]
MKAIMVMFDSLNRHMLPPYGCDWVHAPNFQRLAQRTVTFDCAYICSMPCMPARRELHTGRPNFLHRGWGPVEPFDDSMPEILKNNGVYTHLASDHYHYWEDGGATYHNRYSSWEFFRGQEGDPWIGQVADPQIPECIAPRQGIRWRQDWVNRQSMRREADQPQAKTFAAGLDFIRRNHTADNWFLQIETFDPHEPFFSHRKYKDLYPHEYKGPRFDWPPYREVRETREQLEHCRYEQAALTSMCDASLGDVLDVMDELDLWKDTLLIVNTDHGFLLGEHDCWAKVWCPWYEELAHLPLFIWDPRCGAHGERRRSLVQTIDLAPTLLDFFGLSPTPDMLGKSLAQTVADDRPLREAGLFGVFGAQVNVTNGRYVYMRGSAGETNGPLYEYTLMPTRMTTRFTVESLRDIEIADPFSFTKGCRTMKIKGGAWGNPYPTLLFDLQNDPRQERPLHDTAVEAMMTEHLVRLMKECDAPVEQFERLGVA